MRKCIRCNVEMVENLDIRVTASGYALKVTRHDTQGTLPRNQFGCIQAAVCPECGYIETYLDRLDKIQRERK